MGLSPNLLRSGRHESSGANLRRNTPRKFLIIKNMRHAFVIRLGNDCRPIEGLFEGWVEEVDSCIEQRFRTTEELLAFLGQCFDSASTVTGKARGNCDETRLEKRNPRSQKK
jgi:hypothetical protein